MHTSQQNHPSLSHLHRQSQANLTATRVPTIMATEFPHTAATLTTSTALDPNPTVLSDNKRAAIQQYLLRGSVGGRLQRGAIKNAARYYSVHRNTVYGIWKRHRDTCDADGLVGDVRMRRKGRVGRKPLDAVALRAKIAAIPLSRRRTEETLAAEIGVSRSALRRLMKVGLLRRHRSRIHPLLTAPNKLARLRWALDRVNSSADGPLLDPMYNIVHVDEKWFNEDVDKKTYYLLDGEEPPHRQRKSKRFIGKTMFLAAVARPRSVLLALHGFLFGLPLNSKFV